MAIKDHLEKLNYFYQVAKSGSIKQASAILNITQPSITKSIKILEEQVGSPLFFRLPRGMNLTKEGELLMGFCNSMFSQLDDIQVRLKAPDDPMAGSLKVGTYDSIAIYFWPQFLKKFLKDYPNLDFELTTDRSRVIQEQVESGELDLGFIIEPKPSTHIEVQYLSEDFFQLYCATKHKVKNSIYGPLIYMPDALAGKNNQKLFRDLLLKLSWPEIKHYKTSSLESAKELVINGIGTGLLPKMVAQDAVKKRMIEQIKVKGFPSNGIGKHRIGLIFHKYKKDSHIVKTLIHKLEKHNW